MYMMLGNAHLDNLSFVQWMRCATLNCSSPCLVQIEELCIKTTSQDSSEVCFPNSSSHCVSVTEMEEGEMAINALKLADIIP